MSHIMWYRDTCRNGDVIGNWLWSRPVLKRPSGGQNTRKRYEYLDAVCAFDIETTRLKEIEESIMYVWQFQLDEDLTVVGREWSEFIELLDRLQIEQRIMVYVHNLSYEFHFLMSILDFAPEDVFVIKKRKILRAKYRNIVFRCAYLQTNMSLDEATKKFHVRHQKLSGVEYDYEKVRYPWTPLTWRELRYCVNDVIGLVEMIKAQMEADGDCLYTIPLTSTGYVRRDVRKAISHSVRESIEKLLPNADTYVLLREAFRGGNTHANRYYVGGILENVHSADRSSSYPDVQCNCEYPIKPFEAVGDVDLEDLERLIYKRGKACLFRICFEGIRLKDDLWGCPYISYSKCRGVEGVALDNGRVLSADRLATTLTDIDYKIIKDEYDWEAAYPYDLEISSYGPLPRDIIDVTAEYYRLKNQLKGIEGQDIYYMKSKNKLNSIYGMMAQDPVKNKISIHGVEYVTEEVDIADALRANRRQQIMPYQWGVWVTAWARYRLEEGIKQVGYNFVYADTDSVKFLEDCDWTGYNKARKKDSLSSGAVAKDAKGKTHYMGVFEAENDYDQFVTWGAKKYAGVVDGKLEITVAGVGKRKGASELEAAGGIEQFQPGFLFRDAGGVEAVYNDHPLECLEIDGKQIWLTSNVCLRPSTYRLGLTAEYERLLWEIGKSY